MAEDVKRNSEVVSEKTIEKKVKRFNWISALVGLLPILTLIVLLLLKLAELNFKTITITLSITSLIIYPIIKLKIGVYFGVKDIKRNQSIRGTTLPKKDLYLEEDHRYKLIDLFSKIYTATKVKNIGVIGSVGSGKSSIIETVLEMKKLGFTMNDDFKSLPKRDNLKILGYHYQYAKLKGIFSKKADVFRISFMDIDSRKSKKNELNQCSNNEDKMELKYLEICLMQLSSQVSNIKRKRIRFIIMYTLLTFALFFSINFYITALNLQATTVSDTCDIPTERTSNCNLSTVELYCNSECDDADYFYEQFFYNLIDFNNINLTTELNVENRYMVSIVYYVSLINIIIYFIFTMSYLLSKLFTNFKISKINFNKISSLQGEFNSTILDNLELKSMKELINIFSYLSFSDKVIIIEDVDRNSDIKLLLIYLRLINQMFNNVYNNIFFNQNFRFVYAIKSDGNDLNTEEISKLFDTIIYADPVYNKSNMHRFFDNLAGDLSSKCSTTVKLKICKEIEGLRTLNIIANEFINMCNIVYDNITDKYEKALFFSVLKVQFPNTYCNLSKYSTCQNLKERLAKSSEKKDISYYNSEITKIEDELEFSDLINYGIEKDYINGTNEYQLFTSASRYNRIDKYFLDVTDVYSFNDEFVGGNYYVNFNSFECDEIFLELKNSHPDTLNPKILSENLLKYAYKNKSLFPNKFVDYLKENLFYSSVNYSLGKDFLCYLDIFITEMYKDGNDDIIFQIGNDLKKWLSSRFEYLYRNNYDISILHKNSLIIWETYIKNKSDESFGVVISDVELRVNQNNSKEEERDNLNKKNNLYLINHHFGGDVQAYDYKFSNSFNNMYVIIKTCCESLELLKKINSDDKVHSKMFGDIPSRYYGDLFIQLLNAVPENPSSIHEEAIILSNKIVNITKEVKLNEFIMIGKELEGSKLANIFNSRTQIDKLLSTQNNANYIVDNYLKSIYEYFIYSCGKEVKSSIKTFNNLCNESNLSIASSFCKREMEKIYDRYIKCNGELDKEDDFNITLEHKVIVVNELFKLFHDKSIDMLTYMYGNLSERKQITHLTHDFEYNLPYNVTEVFEEEINVMFTFKLGNYSINSVKKLENGIYNFEYYENEVNLANDITLFMLYMLNIIDIVEQELENIAMEEYEDRERSKLGLDKLLSEKEVFNLIINSEDFNSFISNVTSSYMRYYETINQYLEVLGNLAGRLHDSSYEELANYIEPVLDIYHDDFRSERTLYNRNLYNNIEKFEEQLDYQLEGEPYDKEFVELCKTDLDIIRKTVVYKIEEELSLINAIKDNMSTDKHIEYDKKTNFIEYEFYDYAIKVSIDFELYDTEDYTSKAIFHMQRMEKQICKEDVSNEYAYIMYNPGTYEEHYDDPTLMVPLTESSLEEDQLSELEEYITDDLNKRIVYIVDKIERIHMM